MSRRVDKALGAVNQAKTRAARGEEFALNYRVIGGVKFYYKTFAHAWILPSLGDTLNNLPNSLKSLALAYALAHDGESAVNVVLPQILDGSVIQAALAWANENRLSPEAFGDGEELEKLLSHPYEGAAEKH